MINSLYQPSAQGHNGLMTQSPVTVTLAGSGDAFGSGGRYQACIHLRPAGADPMSDDVLDDVSPADGLPLDHASDGLTVEV
ncbi:MAG TPA: hypothetical protein VGG75_01315 [Trebonia sp.]|jgi:hypothetical protein